MVITVQHYKYTKIQRIVYFKWANFIVGELYHNKGIKKGKSNCRNNLELKSMNNFGVGIFYHQHCLEITGSFILFLSLFNEPHIVCNWGEQHPWFTTGSICVSVILYNIIVINLYSFRL